MKFFLLTKSFLTFLKPIREYFCTKSNLLPVFGSHRSLQGSQKSQKSPVTQPFLKQIVKNHPVFIFAYVCLFVCLPVPLIIQILVRLHQQRVGVQQQTTEIKYELPGDSPGSDLLVQNLIRKTLVPILKDFHYCEQRCETSKQLNLPDSRVVLHSNLCLSTSQVILVEYWNTGSS